MTGEKNRTRKKKKRRRKEKNPHRKASSRRRLASLSISGGPLSIRPFDTRYAAAAILYI